MESASTERLAIPSIGAVLEARWDTPNDGADHAVLFCHPHPKQGGTMAAPLMHRVTKVLVAAGVAVLRFNFRGVGQSTGEWGDGRAEVDDVAASFAAAEARDLPLGVAGWSFGAATALVWQARSRQQVPLATIAPPVVSPLAPELPAAGALPPSPRLFVIGDRDQFVTVADVEAYATSVGGRVAVLAGSDHFFHFREDRVGEILAAFFTAR